MILSFKEFDCQKENMRYKSNTFTDNSFLNSYLRSARKNEENLEYVSFFSSVIEFYSQLRGVADTENRDNGYFEVTDKRGALPISIETIRACLENGDKDAPEEIISIIAQRHFNLIKTVAESLRKVLRRERNKVNMGRAQQMDSQCLMWMSKQPGYTTAQKAGSKQEVLAVVRHESYDTLENRVFKDFLVLCEREGSMYIVTYQKAYPDSKRIEDVRKLVKLVSSILKFPVMGEISKLKSNPRPNYVLQKNVNYSVIWTLYQRLLKKYQIIEDLWPFRHLIIKEYFAILFDVFLYYHSGLTPLLESRYWIHEIDAKKQNGFLTDSFVVNYFYFKNYGYSSLYFNDRKGLISLKKTASKNVSFPFYFIPYNVDEDVVSLKSADDTFPIIFNEREEARPLVKKGIILSIGGKVEKTFFEELGKIIGEKV